jgi:hypothetical protein
MLMARQLDPLKLSSPRIFLLRMLVFVALCGAVVFVLRKQIEIAFMANPALNGLIILVLAIGIALALRQVLRLYPEIAWVNGFRLSDPNHAVQRQPVLLAPMAAILGSRAWCSTCAPSNRRSAPGSTARPNSKAKSSSCCRRWCTKTWANALPGCPVNQGRRRGG